MDLQVAKEVFEIHNIIFYFLKSFCISSTGSRSMQNISNSWPSITTVLPNITISTILIGAEAQSSATSRPPEQTEWEILAHFIILTDFIIRRIDAERKYLQTNPVKQPSAL